ncbi:MAG: hypothetical protein ACLP3C_08120 [Mycobacterium sp.]|uniref:hypothetical protein n=1 Tax=Mycobacterium sp. TaxID=1785 RepID=UPI003F966C49
MLTGDELAAYLQRIRFRTAHHEAGHAVAAVMRGGVVHHLKLGDPTDAGLLDAERESIGVTRQTSDSWNVPFMAFAGPWAEWRLGTETGETKDWDLVWDWLDADSDNGRDALGDYTLMDYDNLTEAQIAIWTDELERHWPAIVAVAAVAFADYPVNTEVIQAFIDQIPTDKPNPNGHLHDDV